MNLNRKHPFFVLLDISQPHPPYFEWTEFSEDIYIESVPIPQCENPDDVPFVEMAIRKTFSLEDLTELQRRRIVRAYWSQCRYADSLLHKIFDFLEKSGLLEDTLIVLTSDHGDFAGEHNCYEKWDTSFLDCIVHVPLILSLSGKLPVNKKIFELTEHVDITPTIYELIGLDAPRTIQGKSLLPLIKGKILTHKDAVYAQGGVEYDAISRPGKDYKQKLLYPYWNKQKTLINYPEALLRSHMIRTRQYKYIHRLSGHNELYDLTADPNELKNIINNKEYQTVKSSLQNMLLNFFVENQTNIPLIEELWA